ncbi:flagellar biosynthetic protein FliO [Pantoea sp. 1.19]|uniref:flagellar biosynthetic protein FliO n=1 Tax=Pantoea sp. 1.19 TaxID=1925589 RepID=UPI000948C16E|nr:flagellar biosynthetic protein FliO [Pantoea sp. 1.19]
MNTAPTPSTSLPVAGHAPTSGAMLTQVSSVLAGIILLILFAGWLVKRLGFAGKRAGRQALNISASCQLGARERVVVVDVEGARLVLGVTPQHITHLHTLPAASPPSPVTGPEAKPDFRQLLSALKRGRS